MFLSTTGYVRMVLASQAKPPYSYLGGVKYDATGAVVIAR